MKKDKIEKTVLFQGAPTKAYIFLKKYKLGIYK